MIQKQFTLNEERNVTLTGYLLDVGGEFNYVPRRPAIVVLPGGGYEFCSDREADPVALAYLEAGYHAFVLRYSVKENAQWPNPLADYEQAMAMIRAHADEWHIYSDKIAVIGFSAGGHLAACAAAMSKERPNAAILGYAVTGLDVKGCNPSAPDVIDAVDGHTCPCFVFATRNDSVVPVENSLRFLTALARSGVSFESHIYAYGPHGFSVCGSDVQDPDSSFCTRVPHWVPDSIAWLRDVLGDFCRDGLSAPRCAAHVNGDWEETLSIDCTIQHLLANPAAREALGPLLADACPDGLSPETMADVAARLTLRDALAFVHTPEATVLALDEKLRRFKNERK